MKHVRPGLILFISGFTFLAVTYSLMWGLYAATPRTLKGADFSIFYTAGRLAEAGQYGQLYDIQAQLGVQEALLGRTMRMNELLPFNHPPLLVPILQIVCSPDYLASYWRWVLVMVFLLLATVYVMDRSLRAMQVGSGSRLLFIVAVLSFYPVFASLLKGQDTAFLLLGGMLWLYGMVVKKDRLAGLGLAMTIIRPQIAVILAVPFLFNRRRVWWWFCAGAAGLALYSLALVGFGGLRDFIHLMLVSAAGEGYGMIQNAMFNFTGMMLRLFPRVNVGLVHGLAWGLFPVAIVGLSVLWKVSPQISLRQLILAVCLSLFAAPHLNYHDLALLLVPVFGVVLVMENGNNTSRFTRLAVLPVTASLALLFADLWDPLRYSIPYLLMVVLPLLAWRMEKPDEAH